VHDTPQLTVEVEGRSQEESAAEAGETEWHRIAILALKRGSVHACLSTSGQTHVLLRDRRLGEVRRMTSGCHDALDSLSTTLFEIVSTGIDRSVGVVTGGGHGAL
jgi:hypothetical protein